MMLCGTPNPNPNHNPNPNPRYDAVWNLITFTDQDLVKDYTSVVTNLKRRVEAMDPPPALTQRTEDLVTLYKDAATQALDFKQTCQTIANRCGVTLDIAPVKSLCRILEKALLRHEKPGSGEKCFDVLRAMITGMSLNQIVQVALAFLESRDQRAKRIQVKTKVRRQVKTKVKSSLFIFTVCLPAL